MRVGIVGCGNVGLNCHLPAFQAIDGVEVRAVADPTPDRLQAARNASGLAPEAACLDWRELIARSDVDAVVVATPSGSVQK